MGNVFEYLETVRHDNIYDRPFTALDMLILTELSYLNYDHLVTDDLQLEKASRLSELAEQMPQDLSMMVTRNRLALLKEAGQSKRYKNIKVFAYVNDIDLDVEKQFSALIYRLKKDSYVIAFRGTDDSIIGWKEDFHMTYMDHVPAQLMAKDYTQKVLQALNGRFTLTGHSKGGNLASYAASQIEPDLQEKIEAIYSFDSPGLNRSIIEQESYQQMVKKMRRYLPQGSIVGMMLENPKEAMVVKSKAIGGFAQHDTFSWQVDKENFVLLDSLNPDSLQVDKTLKTWVDSVSDAELKDFFDLFFGLALDADIVSIDDLAKIENAKKIISVFKNAQSLSEQEKDMLTRLTKLLVDTRYQAWLSELKVPNPSALASDLKGNLSHFANKLPFLNKEDKQRKTDK